MTDGQVCMTQEGFESCPIGTSQRLLAVEAGLSRALDGLRLFSIVDGFTLREQSLFDELERLRDGADFGIKEK